MKHIIAVVVLALTTTAQAQVYVPGPGYPLCAPQVIVVDGRTMTIVICQ